MLLEKRCYSPDYNMYTAIELGRKLFKLKTETAHGHVQCLGAVFTREYLSFMSVLCNGSLRRDLLKSLLVLPSFVLFCCLTENEGLFLIDEETFGIMANLAASQKFKIIIKSNFGMGQLQ